jgi:cytosine/adenosine deaminase-related metal-dependent hydrolase
MMRHPLSCALLALVCLAAFSAVPRAQAQDATIINARIAVGDGPVIEHGYIIVRGGRILMVAPGQPNAQQAAGNVIDATGLTALPGYIDGHKHLNTSPLGEKEQMQDLIDNGFTTVLSALGPAQSNLELIQKIQSGQINGPRIIASGRVDLRSTPEQARATIRQLHAMGIKFTGEMAVTPEPSATPAELAVLRAVVDEGRKDGVEILTHAVSTPAMVAVTEAGVRHQVHLPNKDFMSYDDARLIAGSGAHVLDTVSFGAPIIDVFQQDDLPRFRTGLDWPDSIAGANRDSQGRATGTEAAFAMMNARRIWDATGGRGLGYGSDQNYPVRDVLEHQLKTLMVMLSVPDVIRVLTINTASFLNMQDEIGTLEPLKRADIVLVQGNPFQDFYHLMSTVMVLKDGKVVVDKRTSRSPADPGVARSPAEAAPTPTAATTAAAAAGAGTTSDEPPVGMLTDSVARPDQQPIMSCPQLRQMHLAQGRVTSAADAAAAALPSPAASGTQAAPPAAASAASAQSGPAEVPARCVLSAQLRAGRGPRLQLQLWLPSAHWNGSFLMLGEGDSAAEEETGRFLLRGYAVASSENGNGNGSGNEDGGRSAARARSRAQSRAQSQIDQSRIDQTDRAVHDEAEASKALLSAYYGKSPRYSYWLDVSSRLGGPGLGELQSHPGDFDGVVLGGAIDAQPVVADSAVPTGLPDLAAFAARGGRIIEFRGGANAAAAQNGVHAYEELVARGGGLPHTRSFYRLFLMPMQQHGDSYRTDWIRVLDEWVQRDRIPDQVLATHIPPPNANLQPPGGLVFEPPFGVHTVCAYPYVARLQNGTGETPVDYICLPGPRGAEADQAAGAPRH